MIVLQTNQVRITLLVLVCITGLSLGFFGAQLTGYLLLPPVDARSGAAVSDGESPSQARRVDTAVILKKNIFDPTARGEPVTAPARTSAEPVRTVTGGSLQLFGTVEGGDNPLALIAASGKVKIYRLGDELPGGGELLSVRRNEVTIRQADGTQATLAIIKPTISSSPSPAPATTATGSGIRNLGDNKWAVSREAVTQARSNLNQLLKSARMEPNIVNGQTEGFTVKMVRPKSLLAQLGIRRGDTVTRVNGVELNSPEKALQIFQQLREAKRLTVDVKRGGENMTFDYEVN